MVRDRKSISQRQKKWTESYKVKRELYNMKGRKDIFYSKKNGDLMSKILKKLQKSIKAALDNMLKSKRYEIMERQGRIEGYNKRDRQREEGHISE